MLKMWHCSKEETGFHNLIKIFLIASELVSSRSDGRRMIEQKGVRLDGETLEKSDAPLPHPGVLQVGKRRFLRVK